MKARCEVFRLGRMEYEPAWRLQERLAAEIGAGKRPAALLLLEHPHTYTFGRRGHIENLLWSQEELSRRGVGLHWVDRGGDITYHGPGQLVGYPLIPLSTAGLNEQGRIPHADYVGYIRKLEEMLIRALGRLGVEACRVEGLTGVWAPSPDGRYPAKIAAIGVKVDARGVTRHGFALNILTDPLYWEGIIGCGLKEARVANLSDWVNPPPEMEQVAAAVAAAFGEVFQYELVDGKDVF